MAVTSHNAISSYEMISHEMRSDEMNEFAAAAAAAAGVGLHVDMTARVSSRW